MARQHSIAEARSSLPSLVREAESGKAVELTRRGEPVAVLIGRRHVRSNNSWMHNVDSLAKGRDRCTLLVNPVDAERLGLREGEWATVASRRGAITLETRVSHNTQAGSVFIPFHFREAAANTLTTDKLDPDGKIPEFKFCAVKLERLGD